MKYLALILTMSLSFNMFAQQSEISKAQESLKKGDNKDAIRHLQDARAIIVGSMKAEMGQALPKKVGEFVLNTKGEESKGSLLRLEKRYIIESKTTDANTDENRDDHHPEGRGDEMMRQDNGMEQGGGYKAMAVYISDNLSEGSNIFRAHSLTDEERMREGEPISINGYKAIAKDQEGWRVVEMIVGGAYIRLTGQGLEDIKPLMGLAKAIDADKLKAVLGD